MTEGFILMFLGMGAVFSFLILMIFLVNIAAKLIKPFAHMLEPAPAPARPAARPQQSADDQRKAAAAAAAVQMHRNRK